MRKVSKNTSVVVAKANEDDASKTSKVKNGKAAATSPKRKRAASASDPPAKKTKAEPKKASQDAVTPKAKKAAAETAKATKKTPKTGNVTSPAKTTKPKAVTGAAAKRAPKKDAASPAKAAPKKIAKAKASPAPKKTPTQKKTAKAAAPKSASPVKKPAKKPTKKTAPKKKAEPVTETESEDSQNEEEEKEVMSNHNEQLDSSSEAETKPKAEKAKPMKRAKVVPEEEKPPKKIKIVPAVTAEPLHKRGIGLVLVLGQGDVGQLGLGPDIMEKTRPFPVPLKDGQLKVMTVCAGGMHTVCLTEGGEIWTYGCNDEGALGRDTSVEGSETEPGAVELPGPAVQITAGDSHTAALLHDGRVYAWGAFRDSHGSMGLTTQGAQKRPTLIMEGVVRIASGTDHLVCLTSEGHLYTCGCGEQGQLGRVPEMFSSRGGRKGKEYLLRPQPVMLGRGKKDIVFDAVWTGAHGTFARAKASGEIYVFGLNNYFQLGLEEERSYYQPEIAKAFTGKKWQHFSGGQHHTLILDDQGVVYCLGRKEYGRLGLGKDSPDAPMPTLIPNLEKIPCIDVSAGVSVSYAVTEQGALYSWGMGTNSQLGVGDEEDVFEPTLVKSKQLESRNVVSISAGGQHTVMLAVDKEKKEEKVEQKTEEK